MSLVVSIAREEPLCVKAGADADAGWGRNEKGYGFFSRGAIEYSSGLELEITLNIAVRPNSACAEFANFPIDLAGSGELTDDGVPVGIYAVKRGKASVAIIVPALKDELEANPAQSIELDRVVLATGTDAHIRMIVSVRIRAAAEHIVDDAPEVPQLVQAEIGVVVLGTSHISAPSSDGGTASRPFAEETATAIVFPHGGVVRLAEQVEPDQILILRNVDSKKEAACRVVSVKTNATVKGFVELEFLQPSPGFWGSALAAAGSGKSTAAPATRADSAPTNGNERAGAKSKPSTAATRHVFSKRLEPEAESGETLRWEKPKAVEPAPEREARPGPLAPAMAEISSAVAEVAPVIAALASVDAEVSHTVAEPAPVVADAAVRAPATRIDTPPADNTVAAVADFPESIAAEAAPTSPEAAHITKFPSAAVATSPEPKIAPASPAATPASREKKKVPPGAQPAGAPVLSGGAPFAWSRKDKPKRAGALGAIAAAILLLAAAAGIYRYQQKVKLNASLSAPSQPAAAASTPADGAPASSTPNSVMRLPASPSAPAAGAAPSKAPTIGAHPPAAEPAQPAKPTSASGSAQPGATAKSVAARTPAAAPAAATPPPARGPAVVAAMQIQAPAAVTRQTNQATPAIPANFPSGAQSDSTAGFLSDASQPARPAAPAPPSPATPLEKSSSVQAPRLLSGPAPGYPDAARAAHVQGNVTVDLLIDETGKVAGMTVISGPPQLRDAALTALLHRKYAPAMLDGKPVAAHVAVTIHFQL